MEHLINDEIQKSELLSFIDLTDYHSRMDEITEQCHKVLSTVKNTQIQDGMHIFGQIPEGDALVDMITSILRFEGVESQSLRSHICEMIGLCLPIILTRQGHFYSAYGMTGGQIVAEPDRVSRNIISLFLNGEDFCGQEEVMGKLKVKFTLKFLEINSFRLRVEEIAHRIRDSKEIDALLSGMDGDFIPAGPAGIVTRGRDDVLPTNPNMYSLDPETVPTKAAWEVGRRLGNAVIEKFQKEENRYPENMALYWMTTDIMWADGEGMAQLLYMLGVEPVWLPNGKVRSFRIVPLSELGRPRIDVTVKISSILRDNFQNCINLVDDAIHAVAALNEPEDMNFIRKHTLEAMKENSELTFDDITKTFVANEKNRQFFMEHNPWALEEMSRRLLEACDRGLWNPEDGLLEEIQDAYLELEGFLEEDMGDAAGEFQGSSIEITPRDQMEVFRKNAQKLHAVKGKKPH